MALTPPLSAADHALCKTCAPCPRDQPASSMAPLGTYPQGTPMRSSPAKKEHVLGGQVRKIPTDGHPCWESLMHSVFGHPVGHMVWALGLEIFLITSESPPSSAELVSLSPASDLEYSPLFCSSTCGMWHSANPSTVTAPRGEAMVLLWQHRAGRAGQMPMSPAGGRCSSGDAEACLALPSLPVSRALLHPGLGYVVLLGSSILIQRAEMLRYLLLMVGNRCCVLTKPLEVCCFVHVALLGGLGSAFQSQGGHVAMELCLAPDAEGPSCLEEISAVAAPPKHLISTLTL